jgi:hypothetical protein
MPDMTVMEHPHHLAIDRPYHHHTVHHMQDVMTHMQDVKHHMQDVTYDETLHRDDHPQYTQTMMTSG